MFENPDFFHRRNINNEVILIFPERNAIIYTSRMNYDGKIESLDITAKSGDKVFAPTWEIVNALKNDNISWDEYVEKYKVQMRVSYKKNRDRWWEIIFKDEVVLKCFCENKKRCHRIILEEFFVACGALEGGEIPSQSDMGIENLIRYGVQMEAFSKLHSLSLAAVNRIVEFVVSNHGCSMYVAMDKIDSKLINPQMCKKISKHRQNLEFKRYRKS